MKSKQLTIGERIIIIIGISVAIIFYLLFFSHIIANLPNERGRIAATRNQISDIENILTSYFTDNGCYPSTSQGLQALWEKPEGVSGVKWNGPYVARKEIPRDGWNHELHYQCPGNHNSDTYDLWSYGADNQEGGAGVNKDIGNW